MDLGEMASKFVDGIQQARAIDPDLPMRITAELFLAEINANRHGRDSDEDALQHTMLELGRKAEAAGLPLGDFSLALGNAYVSELIMSAGPKGAIHTLEYLAKKVKEQYLPKGDVN